MVPRHWRNRGREQPALGLAFRPAASSSRSVGTTVFSGGDTAMRAVPVCKHPGAELVGLWILADDSKPLLGSAVAEEGILESKLLLSDRISTSVVSSLRTRTKTGADAEDQPRVGTCPRADAVRPLCSTPGARVCRSAQSRVVKQGLPR